MENAVHNDETIPKPKYYDHAWSKVAWHDVVQSFKMYHVWHYLSLAEIRRRYRRTIIGPLWTTLSIGLFIGCMSVMLTGLWHTDPSNFMPYFSASYIAWILLSTLINDGTQTFINQEATLKQFSRPYVMFACLTTWRNFIVFAHHLVIFALVLLFCRHEVNYNLLWLLPGLAVIFGLGVCICTFLGMVCARYRDIQQIINSMLQLVLFVTPIMWRPEQIGAKGMLLANLNPLYHIISLIRQPLLGVAPTATNWMISIACTLLLGLITFKLFSKKYPIIIYWI